MSTLTGLISAGGGGGGTPVNSIARLYVGGQVLYTDEADGVWLKTGNIITPDETTYPNATISSGSISDAVFTQSFSVSSQEAAPQGIAFNNDGTKMYIVGFSSDSVFEYELSTAFDISTASYNSVSFSVFSQDYSPQSISFNNDGTKMYIVGEGGVDVNEYALSTAFDVSTASYTTNFSVSAQETSPKDVVFNNDGTKMYIVGTTGDDINEYALSTAFDISTASYTTNFSVSTQETFPAGVAFNSNGTKMYVIGTTTDTVYEYSLSTAFDISTASYNNASFSVSAQDAAPVDIYFNNSFTKMYIVGSNSDTVYEYSGVFSDIMGVASNTGTYDYVKLK